MLFYIKMFGISLGLTLVLETGLALLLRIRKINLIPVILVNIISNPVAVYIAYFGNVKLPWILIVEAAVVLFEGAVYYVLDRNRIFEIPRPFLKALILNSFSYAAGIIIDLIINYSWRRFL